MADQESRQDGFGSILPRMTSNNLQRDNPPSPPPPSSSRKPAVVSACEPCRHRKGKCDGVRPTCTSCRLGSRTCIYETNPSESRSTALKRRYSQLEQRHDALQESHRTLQQLICAIQSRSESDARTIFNRVREGVDVQSILQLVTTGDLLLQLQVMPETKYRYDFPYRSQMPTLLQTEDNPYIRSIMYATTFGSPNPDQTSTRMPATDSYGPQYQIPHLAASIMDARLNTVKPSNWTEVCTDNSFMQTLLHSFFLHEYDWFSFFHKDAFLDDMISGSTENCSSLLVNAVMALACHCTQTLTERVQHWNPQAIEYRFFAEAQRLLDVEQTHKPSLTALQAALVMNLRLNMCSMDQHGILYNVKAIELAHDLKLFDLSPRFKSKRKQMCYDFTAWCLYFWTTMQFYHFCIPPLITEPPKFELPDPVEHSAWYGRLLVKYPASPNAQSMQYGHLFKAKCEFAVVLNRISCKIFDQEANKKCQQKSSPLIASLAASLFAWQADLPLALTPRGIVFPAQLKLHLAYHNIVVDLCELIVNNPVQYAKLPPLMYPLAVRSASRKCFETLLRLYYVRHGFEGPDTYMAHCIAVLAFTAQNKINELRTKSALILADTLEDIRSSLILAAKGLYDQGKSYYLPYTLLHIVHREMRPEDARLFGTRAKIDEKSIDVTEVRAKEVLAQYPVNIVNVSDVTEKQRLGNMINLLATINMESSSSDDLRETDAHSPIS